MSKQQRQVLPREESAPGKLSLAERRVTSVSKRRQASARAGRLSLETLMFGRSRRCSLKRKATATQRLKRRKL